MNDAHLDAIADAYPYPYWYDDVDEPDVQPMLVRTESCDLCVVGGGYTGLVDGDHRQGAGPVPRRRADRRRRGAARRPAAATAGSWRRASPTAWPTGRRASPTRSRCSSDLGLENLNEIEAAIERLRHRLRLRAHGRARRRSHRSRRRTSTSCATTTAAARGSASRSSCSTRKQVRARSHSPTYTGGPLAQGPGRDRRPGPAGVGPKAAAESLGVRIYEDTKATALERDGVGVLVTRRSAGARRQGRAGDQRLPAPAAAPAALRRPGVRLRARHRAADATSSSASHRLEPAARASPTSPTSSTTTA